MKSKKFPVWSRTALATLGFAAVASASNHREAPITGFDHKADITDVYAFVSYDPDQAPGTTPSKVTLMMGVDPFLEPANGPTFFPFDPALLYEIRVDNDHDAIPDIAFQFRFQTDYRLPGVFTGLAGVGDAGAFQPGTNTPVVPPRIESFEDAGLNLRQSYSVRRVDLNTGTRTVLRNPDGRPFFAVPANPGPRTINYAALYQQGTYALDSGISVFCGTTDDAFWLDLGAAFDTANFRTLGSGVPGVLTAAEDAARSNFATDAFSGFAVNTIAIEVPIEMLTSTGKVEEPESPAATIGVFARTSRNRVTVRRSPLPANNGGPRRQIQRMGNPLINELVIGIAAKDRFSMDRPQNDGQFADFFLDPPLARIVEALYGGALSIPSAPRLDLLPLVQYQPPIAAPGTPTGPVADLLRLNTGVPATPPDQASRLGLLAGDPAGFPNGRRLFDDVTDIALRVVVGGVLDPTFDGFQAEVNGRLGDGVNVDDSLYQPGFPYIGFAPSGRERRHVDAGEPGGGPID